LKLLLAGATGLVGRVLLKQLEDMPSVTSIDLVGRRAVDGVGPKVAQHIGDATEWPTFVGALSPDVAISTLGTTIRDAGSETAFFAVDHDAVVSFARAAGGAGARHFMMMSSVGAHAGSRNFYLATKGKAEASVQAVGFDRIDIVRPGLLRGQRSGPLRPAERIGVFLSPVTDMLTPRVLDHYRSIAAQDVAGAMAKLAGDHMPGLFVHENRSMWDIVGSR
jgi:uncharacterized protein YbjT (DUF2867 family)